MFGIFEVLSSRPNAFEQRDLDTLQAVTDRIVRNRSQNWQSDRSQAARRARAFPAQGRSGSEPCLRIGGTPVPAGNAWKDGLAGSHAGLAGDRFSGAFGYVGGLAHGLAERNPCASRQFAALPGWRELQPGTSRSHIVGRRGPAEFCRNGRVRAIAGRCCGYQRPAGGLTVCQEGQVIFLSAGFRS